MKKSNERVDYENKLRTIVEQAWDREISWPQVEAWLDNFEGKHHPKDEEQLHSLLALTRFMYFSKRLMREMLKSLYRDHFKAPMIQRIRRNYLDTIDTNLLARLYDAELAATRFVGVGNPAESGAHLLYYFRQVNSLGKNNFVDISSAFLPTYDNRLKSIRHQQRDSTVKRYVFFDDLVGTGTQASTYLSKQLKQIRETNPQLDLRFMSLFATKAGMEKLSAEDMFGTKTCCLFELDESYQCFEKNSRHFQNSPWWFSLAKMKNIAESYGKELCPSAPLGYKNSQLLLGFTHNTPDNAPPIFWSEGYQKSPWSPAFVRFDKKY